MRAGASDPARRWFTAPGRRVFGGLKSQSTSCSGPQGAPAGTVHVVVGPQVQKNHFRSDYRYRSIRWGGAGGTPEGARHAKLPSNVTGLQEGGGPRPLRHDDAGGEARLDAAARGVELLAGHGRASKVVVQVHDEGRQQREHKAEAQHDRPSRAHLHGTPGVGLGSAAVLYCLGLSDVTIPDIFGSEFRVSDRTIPANCRPLTTVLCGGREAVVLCLQTGANVRSTAL